MVVNFQAANSETEDKKNNEEKIPLMDKINDFLLFLSRVSLKEKLFFVQHLSLMLRSGISLSRAATTLAKQTRNKYFAKILTDMSKSIEKGSSFSESVEPYRKVFGDLFISMIQAGEVSGKLEEVLGQLFIQMKKEHTLISKVKGALTYPVVILFAMVVIGSFMFIVIVPKITASFIEMGTELPLPTKIIIKISDAFQHHGLLTGIGAFLFVAGFLKIIRTKRGKYIFDLFLLKMPIISPIVKKINLARFSRNISSLLQTDIMIVKAFQITADVLGNTHYKNALLIMSQQIKKGDKLSEIVETYPHLFTPIVSQMIAVGEETGELDNILVELAEFYEEEIDQIMENLPSIIEPLLILFLGTAVGGVAVAIIMPMYSLTDAM
jgi:type IV pilus assembly protein PilC